MKLMLGERSRYALSSHAMVSRILPSEAYMDATLATLTSRCASTRWASRMPLNNRTGSSDVEAPPVGQELSGFVASLSTVWRDGEVRPTHRNSSSGPRTWRTRTDPFDAVWPQVQQWLNEQPDADAKDLFLRLQGSMPGTFPPGQLRTL